MRWSSKFIVFIGKAKVTYLDLYIVFKTPFRKILQLWKMDKNILRFQIFMNNLIFMKILKSITNLFQNDFDLILIKFLRWSWLLKHFEMTSIRLFHKNHWIINSLVFWFNKPCVKITNNVWMIERKKNVNLIKNFFFYFFLFSLKYFTNNTSIRSWKLF